ncbi:MAG: hypothetical protein OEY21_06330 [Nitrospira sp.]|nr:hypothetical protein [Nitrospira sp.]MDH5625706.1 hypothetical protein [Nitrospira sp.]
MTPAQAAASLLRVMPQPPSAAQLEEYGLTAPPSTAQAISREILSLNLYWIIAAIYAHIPIKYRDAIRGILLGSVRTTWWESGQLGPGTWEAYQAELDERRAEYARLVDYEGLSHMAVSAEAASRIEDQGMVASEDRDKLLVLMIDYAPAAEYGKLLDEAG